MSSYNEIANKKNFLGCNKKKTNKSKLSRSPNEGGEAVLPMGGGASEASGAPPKLISTRTEKSINENQEIFNYIQENNEESLLHELHGEVKSTLKLSDKIRYVSLLNDEADHLNAFIEIHAGAGGCLLYTSPSPRD